MSLTSLLKNKDVREKFSQEFLKPKFNLKQEILATPITKNYGLVGTAFDYLMRFYLEYINPNAITKGWVAESSLIIISIMEGNESSLYKKAEEIIARAKTIYSNYIKSGEMDDEVIRSAILLAQLDTIFRTQEKYILLEQLAENVGIVDEGNVTDLKNLISIIPSDAFKAKEVCILNPTFGEGSTLVEGADVDLVIDNMLIDIKTVKNLQLNREYFNQLIGYYILSRIGGIGGIRRKVQIESLGTYFSRFGILHNIPVKEVIDEALLPSFIEWFKDRANRNT